MLICSVGAASLSCGQAQVYSVNGLDRMTLDASLNATAVLTGRHLEPNREWTAKVRGLCALVAKAFRPCFASSVPA